MRDFMDRKKKARAKERKKYEHMKKLFLMNYFILYIEKIPKK